MSENKAKTSFSSTLPFPCCTVNSEGKVTGASPKISEVFLYNDIEEADLFVLTGIKYKEIAIDSVLNEYLSVTQLDNYNLAIGNLKARIRMSIIYYYANHNNYIVCGTGNRSEILIGYFTKHGDGACDIEPIGNLYKTDVFKLSEFLNIPKEIIEKPPRAGLWDNQTDEDEIGMSYDLLDQILYLSTEKYMKNNEIANRLNISAEEVDMIINKIIRSKHKSKVPESPAKTIL